MNKYAIYTDDGHWLFDLHADSKDEALAEAKKANKDAFDARLVALEN